MKRDFNPGDRIRIISGGYVVEGIVTQAANWGVGGEEDWYIQFDRTKGGRGPGPGYWKQQYDGGTVELLERDGGSGIEGMFQQQVPRWMR